MQNLLLILLLSVPLSPSFLIPYKKQSTTFFKVKQTENQKYATASEKFNARWSVMFERLKEYEEEHGDCLVPYRDEEDPELGRWVSR